jgi:membrane protease YdiL (CAAX protease family)
VEKMNYFLINFLIDFFLVFFPIIFIARKTKKIEFKKILAELGIQKTGAKFFFRETTKLLLILIAVSITISLLLVLIGLNDSQNIFQKIDSLKSQSILLLFYMLIVRVTAEEIFFRGFLAKKIGIIFSSAAFACIHFSYGSIAEIIGTFFLGIVLAKFFMKNKNLMPNIFAHIFYNFFAIILVYSA